MGFFRNFLKGIGMPLTFAELGAKEEDIGYMADLATDGGKGTIGGFVSLHKEDVEAIYRLCL